ncbi:kinase-like domain-containing protein [Mycena polygramma]|nr:kinase-like domain-containing protein [Mycena polygramma]
MTFTFSEFETANLWPLILWIAFRAVDPVRPDLVPLFLDILRVPGNEELFAWDDTDNAYLYRLLRTFISKHPGPFLEHLPRSTNYVYSLDWDRYMAEIDSETWATIKEMTWTPDRPRLTEDRAKELTTRLAAVSLQFSSKMKLPENLRAPLEIRFDEYPFKIIARVVDPDYQPATDTRPLIHPTLWGRGRGPGVYLQEQFEREYGRICHVVWNTYSPHCASFLKRVLCIDLVFGTALQNRERLRSDPGLNMAFNSFEVFIEPLLLGLRSLHLDPLDSFKFYQPDLKILFTLAEHCRWELKRHSTTTHEIAAGVHNHVHSEIVHRVEGLLQHSGSHSALRGTDAQLIIDLLQDVLDVDSLSDVKPHICQVLCQLSRDSGLHPHCFALTGLQKVGQQIAAGGFGDIWKGLVRGQNVCVKIMRVFQDADIEAILKDFGREAVIWRQLCHPNLLPFFGVYYLDNRLCLVSPWMRNGNIMEFLRTHSNTNRLSLILDVAFGVRYLHTQRVVHGDLKAINVLVTPSRRACIADFGLSAMSNSITMRFTHSTAPRGGTVRYQAPELFQGDGQKHYESDVYAVGCVFYEISTGKVPFHELPNDAGVMLRVLDGKRPSRPLPGSGTQISDSLWSCCRNAGIRM